LFVWAANLLATAERLGASEEDMAALQIRVNKADVWFQAIGIIFMLIGSAVAWISS
jgi:hypothetical protein